MKYKLANILDWASQAFGSKATKELKPIRWLVDAEQLHKFAEVVLHEHGVVVKEETPTPVKKPLKKRKVR